MEKNTVDRKPQYLPCGIKDECYHLWGTALNQPSTFFYGLSLKGRLNHDTMKSALHAGLEIHGKLKCVLTRDATSWKRWFQYAWKPQEVNTTDVLKFLSAEEHGIELNRAPHYYRRIIFEQRIDISKESGIRIFVITRDEDHLLLFAFYHAATDGRGALNFIETFISQYNAIYFYQKTDGKSDSGTSTQANNPLLYTWRQSTAFVKSFLYAAKHQYRALREPLIQIETETEDSNEEELVIARKIEGEQFAKLLTSAKKRSLRFYDIMLAAIYCAVKKWNTKSGVSEGGRIAFFASMGVPHGDPKAVGNITAGMILNLFTKDNLREDQVLENIAKARAAFLKHGDIYNVLSLFKVIPLRLRQLFLKRVVRGLRVEQKKRFPTMRIANLGILDVVNYSQTDGAILGDAKLQNIILSPANINEVPFLLFLTCRKEMYAFLVTLRSTFSYERGQEFLALLVQEISEF